MRNVFISFLGTTNYLPCNYLIKGHDPVQNIRFVQEACIARWCTQWGADDRIFICVTDESEKNNWHDNGHKVQLQGLETRLQLLCLAAPVEKVLIPVGKKEEEIWDIFERVFSLLDEGDNLYLDITHAFRSLPMLAMVILSYAKVMRNITVRAISYGAMEALGNLKKVENMRIEDRNVPVFDLLPFDRLQDWTTAIDRFSKTGDGKLIQHLAKQDITPILKQTKGQDRDAAALRAFGKCLAEFSGVVTTCRGLELSAKGNALRLSLLELGGQKMIKPLHPLLEKIEPAFSVFQGEEITDGIAAAQWCEEHKLYQQSYTILLETMITFVVNKALGKDGRNKDDRTLVNQCTAIIVDDKPESEWLPPASNDKSITQQMIAWLRPQQDLLQGLRTLSDIRNDLNHAGQNDKPRKMEAVQRNLSCHLEEMKKIVARNSNLDNR